MQHVHKQNTDVLVETYGPALRGRQSPLPADARDQPKLDIRSLITRVLTRPVRMIYSEWIVLFSCIYLSLTYSVFYLFFEAYPIIFRGKLVPS